MEETKKGIHFNFWTGCSNVGYTVNVVKPTDKVHWFIFGDMHIGSEGCDYTALNMFQKAVLKRARTNKCLITCMGDAVEDTLPIHKHYNLSEHKMTLSDAQKKLLDFYANFKRNKNIKFAGMLRGNHENRLVRLGVHPLQQVADTVGVDLLGVANDFVLTIKCGDKQSVLRAVLAHQAGRRTKQSFIEYMHNVFQQSDSKENLTKVRLICGGHTHQLQVYKEICTISNPQLGYRQHSTCYLCRTGHFLKNDYGVPSYFIDGGGTSNFPGYIEAVFSMEIKTPTDNYFEVFDRTICTKSEFKVRGEI